MPPDPNPNPEPPETPQPSAGIPAAFARGVADANAWHHVFFALYASPGVRRTVAKSFVLNGIVLTGSALLFDHVLAPLLRHGFVTTVSAVFGGSGAWVGTTARVLDALTAILYGAFWLYPIHAMAFLVNALWYRDISNRVHETQMRMGQRLRHPRRARSSYQRAVTLIASELFRILVCFVYLVFYGLAASLLPRAAGAAANAAALSWLAALYSFEYVWGLERRPLRERLALIEQRWAYFLGFGLPITLLAAPWSVSVNTSVFALAFPFYIILASYARPVSTRGPRLPIFALPLWVTSRFLTSSTPSIVG